MSEIAPSELIHEAQNWCDADGNRDTGVVSISVATLEYWESLVRVLEERVENAQVEGDLDD